MWKKMRPPLVVSVVATRGRDGSVNASCKSWWTPIEYDPPQLMVSIRTTSDTYRNVAESRGFVLHLPPQGWVKQALHTSKPLPYGENELDDQEIPWKWLDLPDNPISKSQPWRNTMPHVPSWPWMACRVTNGLGWPAGDEHALVLGEVVQHGGFGDEGVTDVLLHRGRNTFVEVGQEYQVEPY